MPSCVDYFGSIIGIGIGIHVNCLYLFFLIFGR